MCFFFYLGVKCDFIKKRLQHRCFPVNIANGCFCLFKSNFVQFNHFNCLLLEKFRRKNSIIWSSAHRVRVQVLEVAIYFLYVLISHWFSRLTLLTYPLVLNLWVILNLQVLYERSCSTKGAAEDFTICLVFPNKSNVLCLKYGTS